MSDRETTGAAPKASPRDRIVDALMALAAEQPFEEITISQVADRAGVSLADFRDAFPSKGAVLGAFSRRIDRAVLEKPADDLAGESARDRLFDVLMRRLDAMAPYREGLKGVSEWASRDPGAALALNRLALNSMRFMLEAAGLDSESGAGALKLQGLVLAWRRVLQVWFRDLDPSYAKTMAELDRQLTQGGRIAARLDDAYRLTAPLRTFARALCDTRATMKSRRAPRRRDDDMEFDIPSGAAL